MANYLLGAFGIVVSVALFLLGYRQTVGARRERISSANSDLERVLSRRVILENFLPGRQDIDRLRDGKSREYRVALTDILLPVALMNIVYTRLVENDFISPDTRRQIVEQLSPLLERMSVSEEPESEPVGESFARAALPLFLGIITSALGAVVAVFPKFRSIALGRKDELEVILVTAGVSFSIIVAYLLFNRLRDAQEENLPRSASSIMKEAADFESAVARVIKRSGFAVERPQVQSGYDWQVTNKAGDKVLVETKTWPSRVPIAMVRQMVERLTNLVAKEGAKEAILVLRSPAHLPEGLVKDVPVRILSFRELRDYLAH
jgi:Restriction endonuclease